LTSSWQKAEDFDMATKSKSAGTKKAAPKKLKDLKSKKNPKGGVVSLGKLGRVE
jgi:hypothetical protein